LKNGRRRVEDGMRNREVIACLFLRCLSMKIDSVEYVSRENCFSPTPITDLCKRVNFRQSECHVCVDICPTKAISLPFGPVLSDTCINCGLCQIACPTEVFEGIDNTDQMLLDLLQDQTDTIVNDNKFYVCCHQAEADNAHSVAVNCLGNLTENALMAMAGVDVQTLIVTTGKCSSCQLHQGSKLFKQAATIYASLSAMISRPAITIESRENQKSLQSSSTRNRREFLRSLWTSVTNQAAKVVVEKEQQIREMLQTDDDITVRKRPSPRREMLKTLLVEQWHDTSDRPADVDIPWNKMLVDVAQCAGCGVCVHVCPTGALVKEIHEMELMRSINYSLCTHCGVCVEACPQDVIRFEQPYSVDNIIKDSGEVVAKVTLNACLICGEVISVSEGDVCTTCQKRQVAPMFM